jgi:hypothetical protein
MRHVTDTGIQIEQDMRRKYGVVVRDDLAEKQAAEDEVEADIQRPMHPMAAVGVIVLVMIALVVALTLTDIFFLASIVTVPVTIVAFILLGIWAFWSYGRRKAPVPAEHHT